MEDRMIGFEVRTLDNLILKHMYIQDSEDARITLMHGYILGYLYNNRDHAIYQKDLEKAFCIGKSTVTNILKLMEKKGYITRNSVDSDARLKKLTLTHEGELLHLNHIKHLQQQEKILEDALTEEESEEFIRIINKLKDMLLKETSSKEAPIPIVQKNFS